MAFASATSYRAAAEAGLAGHPCNVIFKISASKQALHNVRFCQNCWKFKTEYGDHIKYRPVFNYEFSDNDTDLRSHRPTFSVVRNSKEIFHLLYTMQNVKNNVTELHATFHYWTRSSSRYYCNKLIFQNPFHQKMHTLLNI
jgi:hypothetical protein